MTQKTEATPKFLYKIVQQKEWDVSLATKKLVLGSMDKNFIHLATEDEVPTIIHKHWKDVHSTAVILKLDPKKLKGKLVKERGPHSQHEHYHLHEGNIPMEAVVDVAVCTPKDLETLLKKKSQK